MMVFVRCDVDLCLPSCDNSQPSWLMRLQARDYDIQFHLANKGSSEKASLHLSVFSWTPAENDRPPGQQHTSGRISTTLQPPLAHILQTAFPWMYSAFLQPPLLTFCRLLPRVETQRVLYVSGLPPASLSPKLPTRSLSVSGAVRESRPHVVALVVRG